MRILKPALQYYIQSNIVLRIIIGMIAGIILAMTAPDMAKNMNFLGDLFKNGLKAIAPILVFLLILSAISQHKPQTKNHHIQGILLLYVIGTFSAAFLAVTMSFLFEITLTLKTATETIQAPQNLLEVLNDLLLDVMKNPLAAISEANYLAILLWGCAFGYFLKNATTHTKMLLQDVADASTNVVKFIIQLAPIGIFGLLANTIAETGLTQLYQFVQLVVLLISCMLIMLLIINPLLVLLKTRKNPYPLLWVCLKNSAITAFFTRSSAANIPVNMQLCEKLELDEDSYSVSIPLGATMNMEGAAITVIVMTMATVHTLGIPVDFASALLLSVVASFAACGVSGVAGGSLLLIPLACGLFGVSNDIAMQVVAIGFIISVIQDSLETALNSSTDVFFTAAASGYLEKS